MIPMIIGIDFDNTIASYGELLKRLASERGFITPNTGSDKKEIRDSIRMLKDGESKWRDLQSDIYGKHMSEALPFPGALSFFHLCKRRNIKTLIISHKTQFSNFSDKKEADFHKCAMDWLANRGFLNTEKTGLEEKSVYFNQSRTGKIRCIEYTGCNTFIDDLVEVFEDGKFPPNVSKVLFSKKPTSPMPPGIKVCSSWKEIGKFCLP